MLNCRISMVSEANPSLSRKEKLLYTCWLNQSFSQTGLTTVQSQKISIISPGNRNETEGPDFTDALIMLDGEFVRGNVEIHVRNTDWYAHKHHVDPIYNRVILHVISVPDTARPILTQNGRQVPTLVLPEQLEFEEIKPFPCSEWEGILWDDVKDVLANFSRIRFQRKCKTVQGDLLLTDPEQYFYINFLDVLGYSKNRESFRIFAEKIPIALVYSVLKQTESEHHLVTLESLFLGIAGFLRKDAPVKSVLGSRYLSGLRKCWEKLKKDFDLQEIESLSWHFAGSRPVNHPTRRIAALAQIISKCYPEYPGQVWINQIASQRSFEEILLWARGFYQQPEGVWKNHPLFTSQGGNQLIGDHRLMDLFSNLLLPFAWVIGIILKKQNISDRAFEFAKDVKQGEIPSNIQKFFRRLSIPVSLLDTNYLIQGAIEYVRRFCDLKLCEICALEKHAREEKNFKPN